MKVLPIAILSAWLTRFRAAIAPLVAEKLLFYGGAASVVYGVGLVYKPLGFIVGGAIAFYLSTQISAERHAPQ